MNIIFPKSLILFFQYLVGLPIWVLLFFFVNFRVEGRSRFCKIKGPVVFAGSHRHELDSLLISSALLFSRFMPLYFVSMAKKHYLHLGFRARLFYGGILFKVLGAYPVYKGAESLREALVNQSKIIRKGGSVVIYPEGGLTKDGSFGSPRAGVGFLASNHRIPVVPFTINNIWGTSIKDWLTRKVQIEVVFGEVVYPRDLFVATEGVDIGRHSRLEMQSAADLIMSKIKALSTD